METPSFIERVEALERELRLLRAEHAPQHRLEELPETLDALIVLVDAERVALPLDGVLEVIPRVALTPVPDAPAHMAGYMRWRGRHAPVLDPLPLWSGRSLPLRLEDRIVVVRHREEPRGLLVQDVVGIDRFQKGEWKALGADSGGAEFAVALAHRPEGSVLLVSIDRLFYASRLPSQSEREAEAP
ncbi:MAG TPA: chemotaxis protein CheW [Polyangiaceae bacterium]